MFCFVFCGAHRFGLFASRERIEKKLSCKLIQRMNHPKIDEYLFLNRTKILRIYPAHRSSFQFQICPRPQSLNKENKQRKSCFLVLLYLCVFCHALNDQYITEIAVFGDYATWMMKFTICLITRKLFPKIRKEAAKELNWGLTTCYTLTETY